MNTTQEGESVWWAIVCLQALFAELVLAWNKEH